MFSIILSILCFIVLVPVLTFSLQCFLSFLPAAKGKRHSGRRPRVAALIPAHNEANEIANTLRDTLGQQAEGDRVLVIADNCSDNTAEIAKQFGADVTVRNNTELLGKSHALRHGLETLANDPPDVVIVVDADCRMSSNSFEALGTMAAELGRPVQAKYIFGGKQGSAASNLASSFTLWFKNHIRPLGSARIGMPCQLTGSGMAFPWHTLQQVDVDNQNLAEDTELGVQMTLAGFPPFYCAAAEVDGAVPKAWDTLVKQRRRWEQGYLDTMFRNAPKLLYQSITKFSPALLWSALDLLIPPLALLGMLWFVLFFVSGISVVAGGSSLPLYMLSIGAVLIGASILLGWFVHCRKDVELKSLAAIPWFIVRKVSIYASLLFKREKQWLKTDRD